MNYLKLRKIMESRPTILPNIINSNTDEVCHKNETGIRNFLPLIGDYCSIIITLGNVTVKMHPSINPKSIALHMDLKHGEKYQFLRYDKNEIARDV